VRHQPIGKRSLLNNFEFFSENQVQKCLGWFSPAPASAPMKNREHLALIGFRLHSQQNDQRLEGARIALFLNHAMQSSIAAKAL